MLQVPVDKLRPTLFSVFILYSVFVHVRVCVCVYNIHVTARSDSSSNMVLRGCWKLWGLISHFLATTASGQKSSSSVFLMKLLSYEWKA